MNITAIDISVAIHHYYMVGGHPQKGSRSVADSYNKLTERGEVWVSMLLSTPFPEMKSVWVNPLTNVIVDREVVV